jgi:hypothetical protein
MSSWPLKKPMKTWLAESVRGKVWKNYWSLLVLKPGWIESVVNNKYSYCILHYDFNQERSIRSQTLYPLC